MKKILFSLLLSFTLLNVFGAHIKGGFFTYKYLGPGIVNPAFLRYKIVLTVYMLCGPSSGQFNNPINFTIFQGNTATVIANPSVSVRDSFNLNKYVDNPCITGDQSGCYYTIVNYELNDYELPVTPEGYTFSYQRCCRINNMDNVTSSGTVGNTWSILIPGTNSPIPSANKNNSPVFPINDTIVVCENHFFSYPFSASDPDGDSLVYSFCYAYEGGSTGNVSPNPSSPPPYTSVIYTFPYTGNQPMGAAVTINPVTGLISGIAPPILLTGEYVVTVCIQEYRNGIYFADSRKELHMRVKDCIPLSASSNFVALTCDGFTVDFTNNSTGNPDTYLWNFGDPASGAANTSPLPNPSHTFTAAGIFNVKLVVSQGGLCADSVTKPIGVYPGFFPGFITSAPLCAGVAVVFTDTSKTNYGVVDSWRWDFGDLTTLADTSHLPVDTYTYNPGGIYNVELKVTNSKGCEKTITVPILINDIPLVSVFPHDTTYCGLDTLQLTGTGTGSFLWTPPISIINANTATPLVFPNVPIKYFATLTSPAGCKNLDSLTVTPKFDLSNAIAGPIIICEEDTITLTGSSNYTNNLAWQWSPVATIETPTNSTTRVYPIVTTTYTLATQWGNNCVALKTHTVTVKPLAIPNAGPNTFVCASGQTSVQLNASGGNSYQWTPITGLSNPNIPNPIASPIVPTFYVVAVGVTGCPKLRTDTVFVDVGVMPALSTLNDTLICNIDTLQLTTTGMGNFLWSPNYMISSTTVASPLVSPDVPTWYFVTLTDAVGCKNADSVFIDVKDHVTLTMGPDTTVCQTDGFFLNAASDALSYKWTPPTYLNFDNIKQPFVIRPLASISYHLVGNIGKCQSEGDINIKVVPYPAANAGLDKNLCPGFSTQLNASGGSIYNWTPVTFLNNRSIPDPLCIKPSASIRYIVAVSDTLGCPKTVKDTVWVIVYPKAIARATPKHTNAVQGQPVRLNATGGVSYLWEPSTWLNDPNVANPVSTPKDNITYSVTVTTADGCTAVDLVTIDVYNVEADIYVPTAFTPNGDGINDVLRPKLFGMMGLNYFKVFNRFGEMVFSTSEIDKGWDGNYNGKGQDPATFVWVAEGITYKGTVRKKKGYAVLIR